jgi:hypothetical protein
MSERKTKANRKNGKLGGPKTAKGKAAASLNALKHGLAGDTIVLNNESRPAYDKLLTSFVTRFKPADEVELDLVTEMANSRWRLRRICAIETALLDIEMDDQRDYIDEEFVDLDEICRTALAFKKLAEDKALALLNRYEARLRRQYSQAFANFRELHATQPDLPGSDDRPHHSVSAVPDEPLTPAEPPQTEIDQTNPPATEPMGPESVQRPQARRIVRLIAATARVRSDAIHAALEIDQTNPPAVLRFVPNA